MDFLFSVLLSRSLIQQSLADQKLNLQNLKETAAAIEHSRSRINASRAVLERMNKRHSPEEDRTSEKGDGSFMDKNMLLAHLAQAERHISIGETTLASQRKIVAELERDGHDTTQAKVLLRQFEELQAMHMSDRERIKTELGEL